MVKKVKREAIEQASSKKNEPIAEAFFDCDGCLIVLATVVLALLYLVLPKLLSPIYGHTATRLLRPLIPSLLLSSLIALRPAVRASNLGYVALAICPLSWAVFLRFHEHYFRHDVLFIVSAAKWIAERTGSTWATQNLLQTPVLASSIVELLFETPLLVALVSLSRQKARRTKVPAVMILSGSVGLGIVIVANVAQTRAHHIFWLLAVMSMASLAAVKSLRLLVFTSICVGLTLIALYGTETYSCHAFPHFLKCRDHDSGFIVKDSFDSNTGRISILENERYRLLKADHSLLGGEWQGANPGQSIFAAFYMQSMAIHAFPPQLDTMNILEIGLGAGTAVRTLLEAPKFKDGQLSIDAVELDPAVLEVAHKHFALPRSDPRLKIYNMDAMVFIRDKSPETYDIISHDIFTGGALAFPLFSVEVFTDLATLLKKGGILTVNFVWSPSGNQKTFEAVLNTLKSIFPFVVAYIEQGKVSKINNLVFMCSDIEFELAIPPPRDPDTILGITATNMQKWLYKDLDQIVYDESTILHDKSVDNGESYRRMLVGEVDMALGHWSLMRTLLPAAESDIWIHL